MRLACIERSSGTSSLVVSGDDKGGADCSLSPNKPIGVNQEGLKQRLFLQRNKQRFSKLMVIHEDHALMGQLLE